MRNVWGALIVGSCVALLLTGCTPTVTGYAGLMVDRAGLVHGVVHVCRGSVSTFSARLSGNNQRLGQWDFEKPADATASVVLGPKDNIVHLIHDDSIVSFLASTPGEANSTLTLAISKGELARLVPGEIRYVSMAEGGAITQASAGPDEFAELPCDPFN